MTQPTSQEPRAENTPHPIIEDVANWVIDLTDGAEPILPKRYLRDTHPEVVGKSWTEGDHVFTPIGLHKTEADGTISVVAAKGPKEGGEAELVYIPTDQAQAA